MSDANKPVIFLTFANDRDNPTQFLKQLEPEREALQSTLYEFTEKGWGHARTSSADPKVLVPNLIDSPNLVIFHYSGHANGEQLFFEGMEGEAISFSGNSLLGVLEQAKESLMLVFLNACATEDHVKRLQQLGIPAIIATSQVINDDLALQFSQTFYHSMVAGNTLNAAFKNAKAVVDPGDTGGYSGAGSLDFSAIGKGNMQDTPWNLFYEDPRVLNWTLVPQNFIDQRLLEGSQSFFERLNPAGSLTEFSPYLLPRLDQKSLPGGNRLRSLGGSGPVMGEFRALGKLSDYSIILGEGGMGKSVALMQWWRLLLEYADKAQKDPLNPELGRPVPIYIALHEFNQLAESKREGFLTRYIARHYLGERSMSADSEAQIWKWLRKPWERKNSKIILLLDGFNEITVDKTPLLTSLKRYWTPSEEGYDPAEGAMIVIASQAGPDFGWARLFSVFELEPLESEQIEQYLKTKNQHIPATGAMSNLLRIPMMLSLFASTGPDKRQGDVSTPGELLDSYVQSIIEKGDHNRGFRQWLLEHLLAAICYQMEQAKRFDFRREQVKEATDRYLEAIRTRLYLYFEAFPECEMIWKQLEDPELVAQSLSLNFSRLITSLCEDVGIFRREGQRFTFPHQNFRNYFAARHIINELTLSLEAEEPPMILKQRPLRRYMRQMLGEVLGEHKQVPQFLPQENEWSIEYHRPTLLNHSLENCREKMNGEEMGFILWNIITIWRQVRGDLSGVNLSQINMAHYTINLNEIRKSYLSPGSDNGYLNATFDGSRLRTGSFFPEGHANAVTALAYRADGLHFSSASLDGNLKIWSAEWGICLHTLEINGPVIRAMAYHPDGQFLLAGNDDGTITMWAHQPVWASDTWVKLHTFAAHDDPICSLCYTADGSQFISSSTGEGIKVWSSTWGDHDSIVPNEKTPFVAPITCLPNSTRAVAVSTNKTLYEFGYSGGTIKRLLTLKKPNAREVSHIACRAEGQDLLVYTEDGHLLRYRPDSLGESYVGEKLDISISDISALCYHPDGTRFITAEGHGTLKEWSVESGEIFLFFPGMDLEVKALATSRKGDRFVSISDDDPSRYVIKEWDMETGRCRFTYLLDGMTATAGTYDLDDSILYVATREGTVESWSTLNAQRQRSFRAKPKRENPKDEEVFTHVLCDDRYLIAGASSGLIAIWQKHSDQPPVLIKDKRMVGISAIVRNPNSDILLAFSRENWLGEWNLGDDEPMLMANLLKSRNQEVAAFHPEGRTIVYPRAGSIWEFNLSAEALAHQKTVELPEAFCKEKFSLNSLLNKWEWKEVAKKADRELVVQSVMFSACGSSVAVLASETIVIVFGKCEKGGYTSLKAIWELPHPLAKLSMVRYAMIPTADENTEPQEWEMRLLGIDPAGRVQIYEEKAPDLKEIKTLKPGFEFKIQAVRCLQVVLNANESRFLAISAYSEESGGSRQIEEFGIKTGMCLNTYVFDEEGVETAIYQEDGKKIWVGTDKGSVIELATEGGYQISCRKFHNAPVTSLAFSKRFEVIICGAENGELVVFSPSRNRKWSIPPQCSGAVKSIFPETELGENHFFTLSKDGKLYAWDLVNLEFCVANRWDWVEDADLMAIHPKGHTVICRKGGSIRAYQWSLPEGIHEALRAPAVNGLPNDAIETALTFNADGTRLACGYNTGHVLEWAVNQNPRMWEGIQNFLNQGDEEDSNSKKRHDITEIAYVPTGENQESLLVSSLDGTIRQWASMETRAENTWYNVSGLWLQGCDLRRAHWAKPLTKRERNILKMYGAQLD